jgi:two-component system OmpR family sensor kinase
MFGSLARRLTGWYVFVAVALVVLITSSIVIAALLLYAKDANEQIAAVARQVPDIESRANTDRDDWEAAQALLLHRLARPGLNVRMRPPPPPVLPNFRGSGEYGYFHYPASAPAGQRLTPTVRPPVEAPLFSNRFGYVAASSLGIRPARRPFMGGVAVIFVDVDRVQTIVEDSLAVIIGTGLITGLAAWAIGRYITTQALRPLFDVTSALVRFAGRDFTVRPINVAGRTEFDELVRAYNAAADQVGSAFAERAAAEGQMRQFVADAGHELRTPLTIVLGYIDVLKRRTPVDEVTRRVFDTIAIEGTRMRTLIDNLVLLARLEGEDTRPAQPFALTPLLEDDIVETRLTIASERTIDLNIEVDAEIIGDRSEIYEAIANVVDNALKYAPGAPVRIDVRAVPGGVEISVSDRGPGIDPVDRDSIFDRFYRGSLRGQFEGSGLGLPIAKRVLERAGGSLALQSTSPAGSTFAIRLRADRVAPRTVRANSAK